MALAFVIASVGVAAAQDARPAPEVWRSWTRVDGLPGSQVWAIAQDPVGYVWLGTNEGLVRFDGVRFVPVHTLGFDQFPDASIRALHVARDGSLWIGFGPGGVSHMRAEGLRNYTSADGLPQGVITGLLEDRRGHVWATSANGLYYLQDDRWHRVPVPAEPTTRVVYSVLQDRQGRLWIGSPAGVYRSPDVMPPVFERVTAMRADSFAEDQLGNVWSTGEGVPLVLLTGDGPRRITQAEGYAGGRRLVVDAQGRVLIGTLGTGVLRVSPKEGMLVEQIAGADALSSDVVRSVFHDREGNIWAGTPRGLNRGSRGTIRTVPEPGAEIATLVQSVAAAGDGSVWVGTTGRGLYRFVDGTRETRNEGLPSLDVPALHQDAQGRMWVGTARGIGRIEGGRFVAVVPVGELRRPLSMVTDAAGVLWICDFEKGVFRWDGRVLAAVPRDEHGDRAAFSILADRQGRVWTGHVDGSVVIHEGRRARLYTTADGLPGGMVTGFYEDERGTIWIGSVGGLVRFQNGKFDAVTWKSGLPGNIVTAISGDDAGYLWLGVSSGIVRLSPGDVDEVISGRSSALRHVLYDGSDGVRGDPLPLNPPSVTRGRDGRLWFVTSDGLAIVSPAQHEKQRVPPPIVIETVAADQRPVDPRQRGMLRRRTASLQIDYTALSFVNPEKIRFAYLLEGFDTAWVDAGTRRQAFYTNLPPGDYRFRVRASNDGASSEQEALWSFTLPPAFYQTSWFAAAMVGLAAGIVVLAWRARVHQVRGRFSAILVERTRMAREIHDTLLQSLLGVLFRLDAVANLIDVSSESAKEQLARLRYQVEFYVREARHSIKDLRSPVLQSRGLPTALQAVGARLAGEGGLTFQLEVLGMPRSDLPRIDEHLLRIAQEAITNAVRHAQARGVRVELRYDPEAVSLRVRDDGHGFDTAQTVDASGAHWGLSTMKERADQIGGLFRLDTANGQGTLIEVVAPIPA